MTLVIATCTNRKRKPVPPNLHAASLPRAKLSDLAKRWTERLAFAEPRYPAMDIYGGRAFRDAAVAAKRMGSSFMIVSAGLGLINSNDQVPSYACTILRGAVDSIARRAADEFTPSAWWRELCLNSPYSVPLHKALSGGNGIVCVAVSESYLKMLAADFRGLSDSELKRLRIFTRAPTARIESSLRRFIMPYDDRLDGPDSAIRGTRSDFASRALRHFAEHMMPGRTVEADASAVATSLNGWRMPARPQRIRHDDETMRDLIAANWQAANGGSTRLLRLFRDELNIACEQARFAGLVRQVRARRG